MAINSLSASSYGLSGLVSGMNSQDMVEKLLSGTQSKIDRATQKRTVLQYKQSLYRDVAAKMRTLQDSYLSFTSKTNLLSNGFYNNMSASITPPSGLTAAFSVSASSKASVGTTKVDYIAQLAQAYSLKSSWDASGEVSGTMNKAAAKNLYDSYTGANSNLTIQVGSKGVVITEAPTTFSGMTGSEVAEYLNKEFELKGVQAEARMINNQFTIVANNSSDTIKLSGNVASTSSDGKTLAMRMFGDGYSTLSATGTFSSSIDTANYNPSMEVTLDGRQQTIYMDLDVLKGFADGASPNALIDRLNDNLQNAFGAGVQAKISSDGKNIELFSGKKSQTFTVTGNSTVMGTLGLKAGISNKLNTGMALKNLNFATPLEGSRQTFNINGVEFSYTADTALQTIMTDINNSKAGVTVRYIEAEDRFVIQRSETGEVVDGTNPISMKQTEGNLLTALFNMDSGGSVSTTPIYKTMTSANANTVLGGIAKGGTYTFNVNGTDYKFTVAQRAGDKDWEPSLFAAKMNESFRTAFGNMPDGTQAVTFKLVDGKYEITSQRGDVIKPAKLDASTNTSLLGFDPADSTVITDGTTALSDLDIAFVAGDKLNINTAVGNTSVALDGLANLNDVANAIQTAINGVLPPGNNYQGAKVTYDNISGGFRIEAAKKYTGLGDPLTDTDPANWESLSTTLEMDAPGATNANKLFGTDIINLASPADSSYTLAETKGTNAVFSINGVQMERASNSFEYDGLTFTLNRTTASVDVNSGGEPITNPDGTLKVTTTEDASLVTTNRDTEAIVDGIKEFLQVYNETVNYISELYKADATYKDYPPLTAEEKASMSEREIELWEEKAKEGLLRNDSVLGDILTKMRAAMYTRPEGSSIALYNMGIDTSFYASDGNFMEVSDGAIKSFVEQDPEAVRKLFAGDGGIMELLNDVINGATKSGYGTQGSLVSVAGANALDTSSTIYKQIKEIDDQLVTLENRYWSEYDRYWKQFNSMEQLIQQMNTQSSWLSQQFAS